MRDLRSRVEEARAKHRVPWHVLERDYVISWILAGIAAVPELSNSMAFKGGTALRKCYFIDYRFSEDLDFTASPDTPREDNLEAALLAACQAAERLVAPYAPIAVSCQRASHREPHPGGQEEYSLRARMPWQGEAQTSVKVEVTMNEPTLWPFNTRPIIHDWEEVVGAEMRVYSLEEIVAEKLRARLQVRKAQSEGGIARTRARDLYDLWQLLCIRDAELNVDGFRQRLERKCEAKAVEFSGTTDFFSEDAMGQASREWNDQLAPLLGQLPDFEATMRQLQGKVEALLHT